jgi:hypothetical protein
MKSRKIGKVRMLLTEESPDTLEYSVCESSENGSIYISGIFAQANVVNNNNRIYPKNIMENAIMEYQREWVDTQRAIGEINHPLEHIPNMEKAAILITELTPKGDDIYGKAKVLNTEKGKIIQALLKDGVRIAVSTRGTGSIKKNKKGINEVQDDYRIWAIDTVMNPGAPAAFVQATRESINQNYSISEFKNFMNSLL